jgi:hypothetical protein
MNGHELFERAKALWPEPVPHAGDKRQALNKVYWPLEERLGCEDEWLGLAAWAFHQSFWEHAISEGVADSSTLSPADVPFSIFDRYMQENLQDDSWADERTQYFTLPA